MITFLIAGVVGIAAGIFLRAGALVVVSLIFLVYELSVVYANNPLKAIALCLALMTTIQAGYICGLAMSGLGIKIIRFLMNKWRARVRTCHLSIK